MRRLIAAIALVLGLVLLGDSLYLSAKAQLAQVLIAQAWTKVKQTKQPQQAKPWPWADTYPVARLISKQHQVNLFILQSMSGEALSFGPGVAVESSLPASLGDSIIAGHRDTHFSFLQQVKLGDTFEVENYLGAKQRYQVSELKIVDSSQQKLIKDNTYNRLQLVTCYPFDALVAGGPLRYVVVAKMI